MKYLLLTLIFVSGFSSVSSQNVKNKYRSLPTESGLLYFIYPQKGFECESIGSSLEYDITYLTSADSITCNFTYYNSLPSPLDSIAIDGENRRLVLPASMLFLEPHKKKWKHRVSVRIPFTYFESLYASDDPYRLSLHSKSNVYEFTSSGKDWRKQVSLTRKIFEIIRYNTPE